jgi:hypothetical protein
MIEVPLLDQRAVGYGTASTVGPEGFLLGKLTKLGFGSGLEAEPGKHRALW